VLIALVERNDIDPAEVDHVIGGCVTQSGEQALNITRTAVLAAGFPDSVPATTVDRQCGLQPTGGSIRRAGIMAGVYDVVIAAGVESMSRAPMFSNTQGKDRYGERIEARFPGGLIPQAISAPRSSPWRLCHLPSEAIGRRPVSGDLLVDHRGQLLAVTDGAAAALIMSEQAATRLGLGREPAFTASASPVMTRS